MRTLTTMINKPFYSTKEVAELLSVDAKTVRRYLKNGTLKGTRIGRDYRIHGDSVVRLVGGTEEETRNGHTQ